MSSAAPSFKLFLPFTILDPRKDVHSEDEGRKCAPKVMEMPVLAGILEISLEKWPPPQGQGVKNIQLYSPRAS